MSNRTLAVLVLKGKSPQRSIHAMFFLPSRHVRPTLTTSPQYNSQNSPNLGQSQAPHRPRLACTMYFTFPPQKKRFSSGF